jgi:hypothetical protein
MQTTMIGPRRRLLDLAGEWQGNGTVEVAGGTFPVTGRWICEAAAAHYALRCEMSIAGVPGLEYMVDIEQFGYDDAAQQVFAGTVCNVGEAHHLTGGWDADQLLVEDSRFSLEVRIVSPAELALHVVNKGGGPVFDLALQR